MNAISNFSRSLRNSLLWLLLCAMLVVVCYFFVDRPVAFWVHDHGTSNYVVLKWITYAPPIMETWSPLVLVLAMVRRAWGPLRKWETALFAAALALMVADEFRESLSAVFGRYWPETWRDNNPSLISNNAYGFHWFQTGSAYGSFPSGHMARTVGAGGVFWAAYRHWAVRMLAVVVSLTMAVSLLGMNYHFVSDVIAGSFVGAIVAAYAARLSGLAGVRTTTLLPEKGR